MKTVVACVISFLIVGIFVYFIPQLYLLAILVLSLELEPYYSKQLKGAILMLLMLVLIFIIYKSKKN